MYKCDACGQLHPQWVQRCSSCKKIGLTRLQPQIIGAMPAAPAVDGRAEVMTPFAVVDIRPAPSAPSSNEPVLVANVAEESFERTPTGIAPLDAVLGGGIVAGAVILLGGMPGSGKSSVTTQAMAGLGERVLYATGEETIAQAADRTRRIGCVDAKIYMVKETDLDVVLEHSRKVRASVIVIDSIQTLRCATFTAPVGSPTQIKECTARLVDFAKATDVTIWMIGHVTSDGSLAGPTFLKHLVDVVLELENGRGPQRTLRCPGKNRFGRTTVVGKFMLTDTGLVPVSHYDSSEGPDPGEDPAADDLT